MSERDANTAAAQAFVDEWVRAGVTDAVVCPGSRNSPLLLALARDGRMRVGVVLDERSAAFRALGLGVASGRPAIVCCTSGTAAANFHPAVVEAHHARVPMLVCTADRPPELRDTGAGQTIDQHGLYGRSVRWFCDPGPPADLPGAGPVWRAVAARAAAEAAGPVAGPVHLNLPFREPLLPTGAALVDAPGRPDGGPWTVVEPARSTPAPTAVEHLVELAGAHERGIVVAGWGGGVVPATLERFSAATGWPVLADPISGARSGAANVSAYEALLRRDGFGAAHAPDVIVRVGAPLTSKVANGWLDALAPAAHVVIDPDRAWLDPQRSATRLVVGDVQRVLDEVADALTPRLEPPSRWWHDWIGAERAAREALDRSLDASPHLSDARVARDVAAAVPAGGALVVASSLPVRALEWAMQPRRDLAVFSNRGANGIDGFVSTTLGVACARGGPVVGLTGDLCFLHDTNGLLRADAALGDAALADSGASVTFVVIDNDGGGIFAYLPPGDLPEFEPLFATPQGVDLVAVARAHGAAAERIDDVDALGAALATIGAPGTTGPAVRVLVVSVDRDAARSAHAALWDAVAGVRLP